MELPIPIDEAISEWERFEAYLVQTRYALRDPATGVPLEENVGAVLLRVSSQFANQEVGRALLQGRIITATPFLMNGGNPHTTHRGYYSCYPLGPVADSTEAIFAMERDLVTIFQHAGGCGIDLSRLRPAGSLVDNGQGVASGPVSFAKGFSQLSERIGQGGKRRGALMIQADWDIKDIREFVTFKSRDPGRYAGCNVSVNVTDERFWDDTSLVELIADSMWRSGDPGLLFTAKSLANTPVPARFEPVYANPCGEYLSSRDTACNLLSVNLAKCLAESRQQYLDEVFEAARLACLAGNEILDLGGFPPIERIRETTLRMRPVGVGFTALHRAMNHFDIDYGDEQEAPLFTAATQLALMLGSMQGSLDYGEAGGHATGGEVGVCEWDMAYVDRIEAAARSFIDKGMPAAADWQRRLAAVFDRLRQLGGLYNAVTTSQPPAGSVSQLLRVACTGIEPYFAMIQRRRVRDADGSWQEFTLVPLEFYSYSKDKLDRIEGQTAHRIDPYQQLRIMEACQRFNHTGVSKTVNLPADASVSDIVNLLRFARRSNLKGLTVFRDTSMSGVLADGQTAPPGVCSFSDLDERQGCTFKFKGPAPLYITANRGIRHHTREIFLNTTKSGSTLNGMCEALGRVVSVALQHDHRLIWKLARTLEGISSDSVWQNGKLGRVYSIPAAVSRVLDYYARGEPEGEPEPFEEPLPYTSCPLCGKLTLRRFGGCHQCVSCGYLSC